MSDGRGCNPRERNETTGKERNNGKRTEQREENETAGKGQDNGNGTEQRERDGTTGKERERNETELCDVPLLDSKLYLPMTKHD